MKLFRKIDFFLFDGFPYIHTYSIKTNILCFFSQATIGKNIKKHTKTNILLFSADIHTYKLTFVSFFYVFFLHLPLTQLVKEYSKISIFTKQRCKKRKN